MHALYDMACIHKLQPSLTKYPGVHRLTTQEIMKAKEIKLALHAINLLFLRIISFCVLM